MAAKTSWHRWETKLRRCHPMCIFMPLGVNKMGGCGVMYSTCPSVCACVRACRRRHSPTGLSLNSLVSPPTRGGLIFCWCFIFFKYFSDFCQTNHLNIYWTDLHEICRIGRTLAADKWREVNFFDPSGDVAMATNFVGKIDLYSMPCSSNDIR